MASSTAFKLLFEKYQEDGIKQRISIVKYCQMNGVVYSHFERWYKKYRAGIILPVEIVDVGGFIDKSDNISPSGKKSLKSCSKPDDKPSREEEKEHYDGTPGSVSSSSANSEVSTHTSDGVDQSKVSSNPLDKKRGPRGPYTTMDAAKVEILESRTDLIPAGMKIVGFKDEDEFTRESYVKCTRYRLVILEDEFGVRHEMYIPKDVNDARRPKSDAKR